MKISIGRKPSEPEEPRDTPFPTVSTDKILPSDSARDLPAVVDRDLDGLRKRLSKIAAGRSTEHSKGGYLPPPRRILPEVEKILDSEQQIDPNTDRLIQAAFIDQLIHRYYDNTKLRDRSLGEWLYDHNVKSRGPE